MLVTEWMTHDPIVLGPDDAVGRAAEVMARRRVRRIPIVDPRRELVGIVTRSDVLGACPPDLNPFSVTAPSERSLESPIRAIMSRPAITVSSDSPIEMAAQLMVDRRVGGLPVVASGSVVGMLTESDVFRAFTAALGGRERGLRITFDLSQGEDPVGFAVDLARRHRLIVGSVATYARGDSRRAVIRLVGDHSAEFLDELWRTGHRVLSVLRLTGSG